MISIYNERAEALHWLCNVQTFSKSARPKINIPATRSFWNWRKDVEVSVLRLKKGNNELFQGEIAPEI